MRALAFDVFGTLYDVEAVRAALEGRVENPGALLSLWRAKQLEYTFLLGLMGRFLPFSEVTRRALRHAADGLDVRLVDREVEDLLRAWKELPLHPDVAPALEALEGRYLLVVLSNGDRDLLRDLLEGSGLLPRFAHVLSAEEVGTYKPSRTVYRLAADRLGLPPAEVGLVSSNPFDVLGAKAAGLRALWVNREGARLDPLDLVPDLEVRDFSELAVALLREDPP